MHISSAYLAICMSLFYNVAFLATVTFLITYPVTRLNSGGARPSPCFRTSLTSKSSVISIWTGIFATVLSIVAFTSLISLLGIWMCKKCLIYIILFQHYHRLVWSLWGLDRHWCCIPNISLAFVSLLKSDKLLIILTWNPPGNLLLPFLHKILVYPSESRWKFCKPYIVTICLCSYGSLTCPNSYGLIT